MSKSEKQINRAKEVAKALEEAKSKDSNKRSGQYGRVRALRRGDSTPTFASLQDKPVGEDQDGEVS